MKIPLSKINQLKDLALEEAYIRVCELIGPNSYEFEEFFDETVSKLEEEYIKNYKGNKNENINIINFNI